MSQPENDGSAVLPHSVYRFNDSLYKIIQFNTFRSGGCYIPKDKQQHHEKKLESSLSRSRRAVLEYALCNQWRYFCTFTLDPARWPRHDLEKWHKSFTQWLRDLRKSGTDVKFLFIPEMHIDGAWHMHGLIDGDLQLISFRDMAARGDPLPDKLRNSDYYNWPLYAAKYGHCSLGPVRNPLSVSFYIIKYLTKDSSRLVSGLGKNLYYASHGLLRPEKFVDFVDRDPELDKLLTRKFDFCSTGFARPVDDFDFMIQCAGYDWSRFYCDLEPIDFGASAEAEADQWADFTQLNFMEE